MCGIAGVITQKEDVTRTSQVEAMLKILHHRGPDAWNQWHDSSRRVNLGHRRLSILDLSPTGAQPMKSASGRWTITFNGEIYNYQEMKESLLKRGLTFRGTSDTEVLLESFESFGFLETLKLINGMFAFALHDAHEECVYFAIDAAGEKPLYYLKNDRLCAFSSELKAFRAIPDIQLEVDSAALSEYLRLGYVPAPRSIFNTVKKLSPGKYLKLDLRSFQIVSGTYFDARAEYQKAISQRGRWDSDAKSIREIKELLISSVNQRMVADVPLGAFLSGGIDSSLIVALMQQGRSERIKTFTIGFEEKLYDESIYAREIAKHFRTDHTELILKSDQLLSLVPELPVIYDEPFADSSQIPMVFLAKLARQKVTVALSGDAGDELFGGYNRYLWATRVQKMAALKPRLLRQALGWGLSWGKPATLNRIQSFLPIKKINQLGEKAEKLRGAFTANSVKEVYLGWISIIRDPSQLLKNFQSNPVLEDWNDENSFRDEMMYQDFCGYLPGDILTKTDRATMCASLEGRVPFLDTRVMRTAWSLPDHLKIRDGQGKWILREILSEFLPRSMFERPKSGFAVPLDHWFRGPLRPWVESMLNERALKEMGVFEPAAVQQLWTRHLSGRENLQYPLWNILSFCAWKNQWK